MASSKKYIRFPEKPASLEHDNDGDAKALGRHSLGG